MYFLLYYIKNKKVILISKDIKLTYILDSNGNQNYYENSLGYWVKVKFDSDNLPVHSEDSYGLTIIYNYDENNNRIYEKQSNDSWWEIYKYNDREDIIYFENSDGVHKRYKYTYYSDGIIKSTFCNDGNNWWKQEFNSNGQILKYSNSNGDIKYHTYDSNGNLIYKDIINKQWDKCEYDENNNMICHTNKNGIVKKEHNKNDILTFDLIKKNLKQYRATIKLC